MHDIRRASIMPNGNASMRCVLRYESKTQYTWAATASCIAERICVGEVRARAATVCHALPRT
eukprot:550906-Pleurochrysis_carterae.AAC.1